MLNSIILKTNPHGLDRKWNEQVSLEHSRALITHFNILHQALNSFEKSYVIPSRLTFSSNKKKGKNNSHEKVSKLYLIISNSMFYLGFIKQGTAEIMKGSNFQNFLQLLATSLSVHMSLKFCSFCGKNWRVHEPFL